MLSIISEDIERITKDVGGCLEALSGTTLLVTGASGFLCSYFVDVVAALNEKLLEQPCRLIAVDNSRGRFAERFPLLQGREEICFLEKDVTLPLDLDEKVDWIIHGASIASPTFYRRHPLETIDVNVTGTRHMLDSARKDRARGMLFLSTSEIYGDPDPASIPTREDYRGFVSCTGPRACYDESKRLGETLCMTYHQLFKVPVKVVRPFNVYGPGQSLDDARIIPDLMKSAVSRDPVVLYSDGRASRAFCYITDAISAMFAVLLSDATGESFNVGNDQAETSIAELAEILREVAGPPFLRIDHRNSKDANYLTDNPQRRCPDLTKLRSRFEWEPRVSLREGLTRTLRSYLEQEETRGVGCA
jgi:dTDP-glucose 4,6-dehydratase/UDP-glucuronate decarboxylase